jgi:hypothetical protein
MGRDQTVEQAQSGLERQLLTRQRIEQALEDGRKAQRLQTSEARDESTDQTLSSGHPIEARQVDPQPGNALDARPHVLLDWPPDAPAGESDGKRRSLTTGGPSDGELDRSIGERASARLYNVPSQRSIAFPGRRRRARR